MSDIKTNKGREIKIKHAILYLPNYQHMQKKKKKKIGLVEGRRKKSNISKKENICEIIRNAVAPKIFVGQPLARGKMSIHKYTANCAAGAFRAKAYTVRQEPLN